MATLALRAPAALDDRETAPKAQRRGFWRRAFDRMVEARMRQAEGHLRQYRFRMGDQGVVVDRFGLYDDRTLSNDVGRLPFVR